MAKFKVRYLVEKNRGGAPTFHWQPSKRLRDLGWNTRALGTDRAAAIDLAERLNTELDTWRQGETPTIDASAGSVSDLIRKYRASRFFLDKAPRTKRGYLQNLAVIEKWAGAEPARSITPKDVQRLYDAIRAKTPAKANAVIRVLRIVFEYGRRENLVATNPASKPGLISTRPRQVIWTEAQLAIMVAACDKAGRPSIGTAIMLSAFLGQREGDVIGMTWDKYENGIFKFRQGKTKAPIDIPAVPELAARLADLEITPRISITMIASESTRRPYNEDDFRHKFAEIRQIADLENPGLGIKDLWFMDLRRTAVVWLAEEGATDEQIAAVTGHRYESTKQILETYLPRRGKTAAIAIDLLTARRARLQQGGK